MMKIKAIFSFRVPILLAFQLIFIVGCNQVKIEPTPTVVPLKPTDTAAPLPPSPTHTSPPPSPTHTHTPTFTPTKTFAPLPSPTYTLSPTTEISSCATLNTMPVLPLPQKIAKLTFVNESGFPVSLKLRSCGIGRQSYYIEISQGTSTSPSIETFTVLMDYYDRTTFACEGKETKGLLIVDRNIRLTFTSCTLSPPTHSITP
jgi:hypothetical protein